MRLKKTTGSNFSEDPNDVVYFEISNKHLKEIDKLAKETSHSREYMFSEAFDYYISYKRWELTQIESTLMITN